MMKIIGKKQAMLLAASLIISQLAFFPHSSMNCSAEETVTQETAAEEPATQEPVTAQTVQDLVSVMLPYEMPFSLVLPRNGGIGFVESKEFFIKNNGANSVEVTLDDVYIHIDDTVNFALMAYEPLPEEGNSLYVILTCTQGEAASEYVLSDTPSETHSFWLEIGESVSFSISGMVSEYDEFSWSDTMVSISVRFAIVPEISSTGGDTGGTEGAETGDNNGNNQDSGISQDSETDPDNEYGEENNDYSAGETTADAIDDSGNDANSSESDSSESSAGSVSGVSGESQSCSNNK
jgi:hypothetical protein